MGLPRFELGTSTMSRWRRNIGRLWWGVGSTGVSIIKIAIDSHLTLVKKGPTVGLWQSL